MKLLAAFLAAPPALALIRSIVRMVQARMVDRKANVDGDMGFATGWISGAIFAALVAYCI
jgi:hypothetical protein